METNTNNLMELIKQSHYDIKIPNIHLVGIQLDDITKAQMETAREYAESFGLTLMEYQQIILGSILNDPPREVIIEPKPPRKFDSFEEEIKLLEADLKHEKNYMRKKQLNDQINKLKAGKGRHRK